MKKKIREFSGTKNPAISPREKQNQHIAYLAATEAIVLLKNDGVLPLKKEEPLGIFGGGADHTIKGGTGSGDVCERYTVSIYQGLLNAGFDVTSRAYVEEYNTVYKKAREEWRDKIFALAGESETNDFFHVYANNAFEVPTGRTITKEDVKEAKNAIYVVSRVCGEGADRADAEGDYYLSKAEVEDLHTLAALVDNIILIINSGGQIDLKAVNEISKIRAILTISQLGMEGGNALASVLCGDVSPSGKLTNTWAVNYEDFPGSEEFSFKNGNVEKEIYKEGIFVGYRYFDSFEVKTEYPFGFGLSYTTFDIKTEEITADGNEITVKVSVKNTGDTYAGKEVVQVYAACPQTDLIKEKKRLIGFAKTSELKPQEDQILEISVDAKALASFDEEKSAYVCEAGQYGIFVGNSCEAVYPGAVLEVSETVNLEKVNHICPVQESFIEELPCEDDLLAFEAAWKAYAKENGVPTVAFVPEAVISAKIAQDSYEEMAAELVEKLTDDELAHMVVGEVSKSHNLQLGSAGIMVPGAAGETCSILEEQYDVPGIAVADGPAGIRVYRSYEADEEQQKVYTMGFLGAIENGFFMTPEHHDGAATYYQYCTAIPVGTALAQTWNMPLLEQVGYAVGTEMEELGITLWLAPGMNIHRNPLCGRNFEYYSEDPTLSGMAAAAVTRGVQRNHGVGTTIKHYACNNQEDNRIGCDSILSERALREIYLRGFEIAVKTSQPMSIMTSYNLINGVHTANNWDICTEAARNEWDFQGAIMTDWTTTSATGGSTPWRCVWAGNDLIMPGEPNDISNILAALSDGTLDREQIKLCVKRLLKIVFQSLGYEDSAKYGDKFGF